MIENKDCWLQDKCNHCDCDNFCMRLFKLDYLYSQALLPLTLRKHVTFLVDENNADVEEYSQLAKLSSDVCKFVDLGESLYIHSTQCGNGKTSFAIRFIENYFNTIWINTDLRCRALFINVPRFLLALKDNISDRSEYIYHIKENINSADIVIWDDIATKTSTVFEAENLLSMLDGRVGKSNIFTSNLSDEELHSALGDRLASRICGSKYNIILKGKDKRSLNNDK